jgi:GST-like protein
MSIVFYSAPMSSATPVACALAELKVPHETVTVDISAGKHRTPDFLRLNPNGKVPTLVVDGTPMFEALAIMLWLGERHGVHQKLWPAADSPARLEAMAWSTWAYVTFGPLIPRLQFATSPRVSPELHNAAQAELARKEINQLLDMLEARLTRAPHLLGEAYSLADLIVASVVGYGSFCGISLERHSRVKRWHEQCQQRPSFQSVWKQG